MIYIKKTFSYLLKSFWMLLLIALIPAILLGLFVRPLGFLTFIPQYSVTQVSSFGDIAWLIFDKYALIYVYPILLIFVALTLSCSISLSVIEKHFRVGKLLLRAPLQDINSSFFPVLKTLAVMTGVYLLWKFLLSGLTTLLHFVISGQGRPSALNVVLLAVIIAVLFIVVLYFGLPSLFWAPLMLTFGYSFLDAFIESAKLTSRSPLKLLVATVFPFAVVILLQTVFEFLPLPIFVSKIIAVVLYLLLIVYIVSFMMVATFELTGIERRDLKKKYV